MRDINVQRNYQFLIWVGILLLIGTPLFINLGNLSLRIYDESRIANNAFEMLESGDYIVARFNGAPDMWNTKPPFLLWCQVLFMKIMGVSVLALRLPVAISALGTCIALIIFLKRYVSGTIMGFVAALVLVTSLGYVSTHGSRTGEYDAMVTLFTTGSALFFFCFLETKKKTFLYLFFLMSAVAVLTKSVTGLLFIPAMSLYAVLSGNFLVFLKNKHFYIGLFGFILVVATFYLGREYLNEGYLQAVYNNELGGRYNEAKENIGGDSWFYVDIMTSFRFKSWYIIALAGLLFGLFNKNLRIRKLSAYLTLLIASYLYIISSSATKHVWYDIPLYPFLSIFTAIFILTVFNFLTRFELKKLPWKIPVISCILLGLLFYKPYRKVIERSLKGEPDKYLNFHMISYYLEDALEGKQDVNGTRLLFEGNDAALKFYVQALKERGVNIQQKEYRNLEAGSIVLASQPHIQSYLKKNYTLEVITKYNQKLYYSLKKYKVHGRKK